MNDTFTELFEDLTKALHKYYLYFSVTVLILSFSGYFYPVLNIILYLLVTIFIGGYLAYSLHHKKKFRLLLILHLTLLLVLALQSVDKLIPVYLSGFFLMVVYLESKISILKSSTNILKLLESRFPTIASKLDNFKVQKVSVDALNINDVVVVNSGEVIPVDGVVESGSSNVDESGLTGDFMFSEKHPGSEVIAGSINKLANLTIKITKDKKLWLKNIILDLVREKRSGNFYIDQFDKLYLPNILVYLVCTILVTTYVLLTLNKITALSIWYAVAAFPLGLYFIFVFSIEHFTKALEKENFIVNNFYGFLTASLAKEVVFGKSGVLVDNNPEVLEFRTYDTKMGKYEITKILEFVYVVQRKAKNDYSNAILSYINNRVNKIDSELFITQFKEESGNGVTCKINNYSILIGNYKLCEEKLVFSSIKVRDFSDEIDSYKGEAVYVVINKEIVGIFSVTNPAKPEINNSIQQIKSYGLKTTLLTSDKMESALKIYNKYGLDEYYYGVTPIDKAEKVGVIKNKSAKNMVLAVGDAFGDLGGLIESDISVSLNTSAEILKNVSSLVLPTNSITSLPELLNYSFFTRYSIMRNLWINMTAYPLIVFVCTYLEIPNIFPLMYSLVTIPAAYFISFYTSKLIIKKENLKIMNEIINS